MQAWLGSHNIPNTNDMVRKELYTIVKIHKGRFQKYRVDTMAEEHGHRVLRLPPYHCQLNPIELIWAQVKRQVARTNDQFKLPAVEALCHQAVTNVTPTDLR